VVAVFLPWGSAAAQSSSSQAQTEDSSSSSVYVSSDLLAGAQANPHATFSVIVQGNPETSSDQVARQVANWAAQSDHQLVDAAHQADAAVTKAQGDASRWGQRWAQARQDAARARADWTLKTKLAAATRSKKDRDAAASAARNAAAKAQAATQAEEAANAAQTALTQAQSADAAANGQVAQLSSTILQQQIGTQFSSISGVSATLTGAQVDAIASHGDGGLLAITTDATVHQTGSAQWSSNQLWPYVSGVAGLWGADKDPGFQANMPSIAVVDSGIANRSDFGSRVIASAGLSSLPGSSTDDPRGHGTFVAGIAAGSAPGYAGADPVAKLVNVDVLNDKGEGLVSDVIKACEWILDHQSQYNIHVANFSLNSTITAPFYLDPLDRAIEQLWFHGIVVVTSAGNYGTPSGPSGVDFSPADDPFVITVGAADLGGTPSVKDDAAAPWSAWGYTVDGFAKPELSAPGRFMVGPVPDGATLVSDHPQNVMAAGYMQLSGTSFAAPVVSGIAAQILARHPDWTPDQVKGALMLSAQPMPAAVGSSAGVGEVKADGATAVDNPPNPNSALEEFVVTWRGGAFFRFDAWRWTKEARSNAAWNSAAWNSAAWNSAAWNSAAWNSAAWNSAAWNSAAWNSAAWNSAAWNSAAWNSTAAADGAETDPITAATADILKASDLAALLALPGLDPATLPDWLTIPVVPAPKITSPAATVTTTTTPTATTTTTTTTPTTGTTTTAGTTTITGTTTTGATALTATTSSAPGTGSSTGGSSSTSVAGSTSGTSSTTTGSSSTTK
jgi:serine protease AprX